MKKLLSLMAVLLGTFIYAQTTVTGTVIAEDNVPIPGANVVFDSTTGAVSDFDGNFTLVVNANPPFDLKISSVGFDTATVNVTAGNLSFTVTLAESQNLLDEVVISASRTPERLFESPVTVERFDYKDIAQSTGQDFYTSLEGLKGVQVNSGGLLLQAINTRGFSTVYNEGFVQLVDGMDNAAPGLNFSAGNLVGISEIDIQSVEVLPGASSALYGANAFKGIMLMNSKSPFDFPGFNAYIKSGVTSHDSAGDNLYYDVGARFAHNWDNKFAFKAVISYVEGTDWAATDYSDINYPQGRFMPGTVDSVDPSVMPDYNGVNVYGEVGQTFNMTNVFRAVVLPALVANGTLSGGQAAQINGIVGAFAPNYFGTQTINSTGYKEVDLGDNKASSFKVDLAGHYRIDGNKELIFNSKFGSGNTVLHATNRNMLKNFALQQHKLEYRSPRLTARAYTTIEDSGNTHDMSALGGRIANAQPGGIAGWFGTYLNTYFGEVFGLINPNPIQGLNTMLGAILFNGITDFNTLMGALGKSGGDIPAHIASRKAADMNMLVPGSDAFKQAYYNSTTTPIANGGAAIIDNSKANSFEFNYNLGDLVPAFDLTVGAQYRDYILRSGGSLFTDYDGPIKFNELGVYTQVQKSLLDGAVKLTGSMRYDKSQYFDGSFTPRLGALVFLSPQHNVRVSYQTGFQNPSSQDQYIGLDAGVAVLMGSSPDSIDRFRMNLVGQSSLTPYTVTGNMVMNNSYTLGFLNGDYSAAQLDPVEPQYVSSREVGYRYNGKKVSLDVSAHWSKYQNFIAAKNVLTPLYGSVNNVTGLIAMSRGDYRVFSVDNNTDEEVTTMGASVGLDSKIGKFDFGTSFSYNEIDRTNIDPDFETGFNTPKVRTKFSLGSTELSDKFAFNVNARYHNSYMWESSFLDGMIPANWVFDAQLSFDAPELNGKFKVGAVNLSGKDYLMMPGSGLIGSQYYVQFTLNP